MKRRRRLSDERYAAIFTALWTSEPAEERDLVKTIGAIADLAFEAGFRAGKARALQRGPSAPKLPVTAGILKRARPYREAIAARHGISLEQLGLRVHRSMAIPLAPLHELAWLLRTHLGLSYPHIAVVAGWSDHTTAIDAVNNAEAVMGKRPGLREELLALVAGGDARVAAVGQ